MSAFMARIDSADVGWLLLAVGLAVAGVCLLVRGRRWVLDALASVSGTGTGVGR